MTPAIKKLQKIKKKITSANEACDIFKKIINSIIENNIANSKWEYIDKDDDEYVAHISGFDTDEIKELLKIEDGEIDYYSIKINDDKVETYEFEFDISYDDDDNKIYMSAGILDNLDIFKKLNVNFSYSNEFLLKKYKKFIKAENEFKEICSKSGYTKDKLAQMYLLK